MRRLLWVYTCLCVFFSAHVSCGARSMMREDAEELFNQVNEEKYEGLNCPEPQRPANSDVTGTSKVYPVGSVVYVICNEGFSLRGPAVMWCVTGEEGAHWDPQVTRQCVEGTGDFEEREEPLMSWETEETEETGETQETEETEIQYDLGDRLLELSQSHLPPYLGGVYLPWASGAQKHVHMEEGAVSAEELAAQENSELAEVLALTPKFCLLPPEAGSCKAAFKRFYFDKASAECRSFVYGGCDGNMNRFKTQEDCDRACMKGD